MPFHYFIVDNSGIKKLPEEHLFSGIQEFIKHTFDADISGIDINIQFFRMKDLHDSETYLKIANSPYRMITNPRHKNSVDLKYFYPTVTIGLENIMNDDNKWNEVLNVDPRYKFFDSSTWHRYVNVDEKFHYNFNTLLKELIDNHGFGLYDTNVSREFLEFETRMLQNSYLADVGGRGHSQSVTPFKFHSETYFKYKFESEKTNIPDTVNWNALLIDDHCITPLKSYTDSKNINKNDILKNILEKKLKINFETVLDESCDVFNNEDRIINKAVSKLNTKTYDILFLDYLLSDNEISTSNEYGNELFDKILDIDELKHNRGPIGKYWVFPITGFSEAMQDELHQRGISSHNEFWYLDSGADPINTPYLFLYKLYKFLNVQLNEILYNPKDILNFIADFPFKIENSSPTFIYDFKESIRAIYSMFLHKFGKKEFLKSDIDNKSELATTLSVLINSTYCYSTEYSQSQLLFEAINSFLVKIAFYSSFHWKELLKEKQFLDDLFVKNNFYGLDPVTKVKFIRFNNFINKYIFMISK